jgi:hypothetical protein
MKTITDRISKTYNVPEGYLSETPPVPRSVKIEITSRCDFKCFFCEHTFRDDEHKDIAPALLYKLLEELSEVGVEEVGLFWIGESLLVKELPEYVTYAKSLGFNNVFLTTNGRLATSKRVDALLDAGLDSIKFSVSGSNKENYISVTGVDAFDKVMKNMRYIYSARGDSNKPGIFASSYYDVSNPTEYEKIDELITPFVDEHYPLRLYGSKKIVDGNSGNSQIVSIPRDERKILQSMLPCWSLFTVPHINKEGYLSACFCDPDEKLFMADLKEVSFMDGWHSDKFRALRRAHLSKNVIDTPCEHCIAYR